MDNTLAEDHGLYPNLANAGAVPFAASPAPPYGTQWSGPYGNAQFLSSSAQMADDFDAWGTWTLYWQSVRTSTVGPGRYVLWSAGDPNFYISLESNGRIRYQYVSGSFFDSAASFTAGTNYQLAVRYNGSNVRIYLGTSPGSTWTDIGTCAACPGNIPAGSHMYMGNYWALTNFGWPGYAAGWMGFDSALDSPPALATPTFTPTRTRTASPSSTPTPTLSMTPVMTPMPGSVCSSYGSSTVAFYGGNSDGQLKDALGGPNLLMVGSVPHSGTGYPEGDAWLGTYFAGSTTTTQTWLEIPPSVWPGTQGAIEMKIKFVSGAPNNLFLISKGADFISVNFTEVHFGLDCVISSSLVAAPYGNPGLIDGEMYTVRLEWGAFGMRTLVDGVTWASTAVTTGWSSVDSIIIGAYPGIAFRDLLSPVDALAVLNDPTGVTCLSYGTATMTSTPTPTPPSGAACLGQYLLKWGSNGTGNGQFNYPVGIAMDPSGNVYVVEQNNQRVQKFSSNGAYITQWGSPGVGNGQFSHPQGVALDSLGNVYVADMDNDRIQKFDANGAYLTQWGGIGTANGQLSYPMGLAVDASDNVYVADQMNERIQKFSSSGTYIAKWGSLGSADGQFVHPMGIVVDPSGNVFVEDTDNHRIQKFNSSGVFLTKWGTAGSGNGQFNLFNGLTGMAVDPSGDVYIADQGNHRIQEFSSSGAYLAQWGSQGTADGQLSYPQGVALDSLGSVYVVEYGGNRVQKFGCGSVPTPTSTPTPGPACLGSYLLKWGSVGVGNGQFNSPGGVAMDPSGNVVYVTDWGNNRVQKFSSSGAFVSQWGTYGTGNGQFDSPAGIAVDSSGNVYVADSNNNRIQEFNSGGTYLTQWGSYGTANGQFGFPMGLALDAANDVYVADTYNQRVQKFSASGVYLTQWGSMGTGDGQFIDVPGVSVDSAGNVYTVDYSGNRVQKFTASGTFLAKWGSSSSSPGSGDGQMNSPWGIGVDPSDNVYVADLGNERIQEFSSNGAYLAQWGSFGTGNGQFDAPEYVAADPSGNIYVSDSSNNRVQKFGCSPSAAQLSAFVTGGPLTIGVGQTTTLVVTVSNTGGATAISATVVASSIGTGALTLLSGPNPPNAAIPAGASQSFTYTFQGSSPGYRSYQFTANAIGVSSLAASSPNISIMAPVCGSPVFQDDFESDTSGAAPSHWAASYESGTTGTLSVLPNGLGVIGQSVALQSDLFSHWMNARVLTPSAQNLSDMVFEAKCFGAPLLLARIHDSGLGLWNSSAQCNDCYGFGPDPSFTSVNLFKMVAGAYVQLSNGGNTYSISSIPTGTTITARLEIIGNHLRGYVNGLLAVDLIDSTHASGGVALMALGYQVYDDVSVWSCPVLPTPTPTPTATPIPTVVPSPVIDDYDDGNFLGYSGGSTSASILSAGFGGNISINFTTGSTYSGSSAAAHCNGHLIDTVAYLTDAAEMSCTFIAGGGPVNLPPVAPDHAISFSYKGDVPGQQIEFGMQDVNGNRYTYTLSFPDTNWHELTVYFPDVSDASLTPRLTPQGGAAAWSVAAGQMTGCYFKVVGGADASDNFGFAIDDLRFGQPESDSSPAQTAAALGVTVTQVNDAYNLQLDEYLTRIVLLLAKHCGCSVQQIMTLRETRSWGQVAVYVGTTWAAILAEVNGAGLPDPLVDVTKMEQSLHNGPMPTPVPKPKVYVPVADYIVPPPTGGTCP